MKFLLEKPLWLRNKQFLILLESFFKGVVVFPTGTYLVLAKNQRNPIPMKQKNSSTSLWISKNQESQWSVHEPHEAPSPSSNPCVSPGPLAHRGSSIRTSRDVKPHPPANLALLKQLLLCQRWEEKWFPHYNEGDEIPGIYKCHF